jgi:hypothetical protein
MQADKAGLVAPGKQILVMCCGTSTTQNADIDNTVRSTAEARIPKPLRSTRVGIATAWKV